MLFTQQDLGVSTNAFGILNESIYIDHNTISPNTASVIVNEDINAGIVRFSDVESISEEYGCDYIDAMIAIAESNDIDIEQLAVAVDEARIIEEPDIIYELANVVINPISENSLAYVFCESMVDAYIDSGDEDYLACIIDEEVLMEADPSIAGTIASGVRKGAGAVKKGVSDVWNGSSGARSSIGSGINSGVRTLLGIQKGRDKNRRHLASMETDAQNREKYATQAEKQAAKHRRNNNMVGAAKGTAVAQQARQAASEIRGSDEYQQYSDQERKFKRNTTLARAGVGALAAGALAYKNRDKLKAGASAAKGIFDKLKGKIGGGGENAATNAQAVLKQAEGKPKSWISKKIASLRSIYQNYLQKAREAGPNAGTFKQIAAKILSVIDALLQKLENATA